MSEQYLISVLQKAFGKRMNSMWSAWANERLTEEEIAALAEAGVEVQRNCNKVTIQVAHETQALD